MARSKSFQEGGLALASMWGSAAVAQDQGGRVHRSARFAGVKVDVPLTPAEMQAQQLADELAHEAEQAAREADPRSDFDKRYDIRDGVAHITPEEFRSLFTYATARNTLRNAVNSIHIDDGQGLEAEFTFLSRLSKAQASECTEASRSIDTRLLLQQGLSGTKKGEKIIIANQHGAIGILRILEMPEALASHAQWQSSSVTSHSTSTWLLEGNAAQVFNSVSSTQRALETTRGVGLDISIDTAIQALTRDEERTARVIGKLWHPDDYKPAAPGQYKKINFTNLSSLKFSLQSTELSRYLNYIFGEDNTSMVILNRRKPLAILERIDAGPK